MSPRGGQPVFGQRLLITRQYSELKRKLTVRSQSQPATAALWGQGGSCPPKPPGLKCGAGAERAAGVGEKKKPGPGTAEIRGFLERKSARGPAPRDSAEHRKRKFRCRRHVIEDTWTEPAGDTCAERYRSNPAPG